MNDTPLRITCHVSRDVAINAPIALDALLGFALAQRLGLQPPQGDEEPVALDIPLARSTCGRIYLGSHSIHEVEEYELRWRNRRFPVPEAQAMGGKKLRRINTSTGATKTKRVPREALHLHDGRLDWYAVGDEERVRDLLFDIQYVGGARGVGSGRVASWAVEDTDPWEPGFPVLLDGIPLRSLPVGWPGVDESRCRVEQRTLEPPYWWRRAERQVPCWVAM